MPNQTSLQDPTASSVAGLLKDHETALKSSIAPMFQSAIKELPSPSEMFANYTATKDPQYKTAAGNALDALTKTVSNIGQGIAGNSSHILSSARQATADILQPILGKEVDAQGMQQPVKPFQSGTPIVLKDRGVTINSSDIEAAKPIIFAEVSNRTPDKQELEAQTILNTAINRLQQYQAKGIPMTLKQVLEAPNQYQGYQSNQYKIYNGQSSGLDLKKKMTVDSIVDGLAQKMMDGKFDDNTGGDVYYSHTDDGRIYAHTGNLFK